MGSELLPCPFCGGEASDAGHIHYKKPLVDAWWDDGSEVTEAFCVNCIRCGAVCRLGPVGGYRTKDEAITAWNTRATVPPSGDEVERVAKTIREYSRYPSGTARISADTAERIARAALQSIAPVDAVAVSETPSRLTQPGLSLVDDQQAVEAGGRSAAMAELQHLGQEFDQAVDDDEVKAMVEMLRGRIGEEFDWECHLTNGEAEQLATLLEKLSAGGVKP